VGGGGGSRDNWVLAPDGWRAGVSAESGATMPLCERMGWSRGEVIAQALIADRLGRGRDRGCRGGGNQFRGGGETGWQPFQLSPRVELIWRCIEIAGGGKERAAMILAKGAGCLLPV